MTKDKKTKTTNKSSKQKNKKSKDKDPFFEREVEKYANPIASREFILAHLLKRQVPANLEELLVELEISLEQEEALERRIKAMLRDNQLEKLKGKRFWPADRHRLVEGTVAIEKNKYRLLPKDGGTKLEITNFNQLPVYSGLTVIASVPDIPSEEILQCKIIEVLAGKPKVITGRFVADFDNSYVIPHSREFVHDVLIPKDKEKDAKDGDIVAINIINKDFKWTEPFGEVIEVLGNENIKGIEIRSALMSFDIPFEWPKDLTKEVSSLNEDVPDSAKNNRIDLRNTPFVTIDGEDAKDFDDAVYCEVNKSGGWRLFVAIADVSNYVQPNSALDKEAVKRGNSVYFPGQVVPMLPEILSNGLCSLKPKVDRLAMVCEMAISKSGKVSSYKFYEAVIHSHARLTYTKVHKILTQQSNNLLIQYKDLVPHLEELENLYKVLRVEREKRGAIDFDTVETKIIFNKSGKISKIEPVHRNIAHKIIEECMLAANESTAKFLKHHKIPSIYRIHEAPQVEKFLDLQKFLFEVGVRHKFSKEATPLDYGRILQEIRDRKDADIIQMVLLRSLSQAIYSPDNVGHFGLAYPSYTHFTSPIRRYPDLVVHRQIKSIINNEWAKKATDKAHTQAMLEELEKIAEHCSTTERRADDATRDVVRWLKCQYMASHIGSRFKGVICSVTRFGFFVELTDIYIDGLVHVTSLDDDYYLFDAVHHKLVGESLHFEYKMGMPVEVIVAKVDVDDRKIDFELTEHSRCAPLRAASNAIKKDKHIKKSSKKNNKPSRDKALGSSNKVQNSSKSTKSKASAVNKDLTKKSEAKKNSNVKKKKSKSSKASAAAISKPRSKAKSKNVKKSKSTNKSKSKTDSKDKPDNKKIGKVSKLKSAKKTKATKQNKPAKVKSNSNNK